LLYFCKMSLFVASLNSGSSGNCYYVGNQNEAIFVDAGLPCREVDKRMKRLGLNTKKVKAIFVTHEHGDHIKGLEGVASRHHLPIYITPGTLKNSKLRLERLTTRIFRADEQVMIGGLTIHAFPKPHDAADPHNFVIESDGVKVGVMTDIGHVNEDVIRSFNQCHAVFLEANYDEEMLRKGKYPAFLKERIIGPVGHLSNRQALELFLNYRAPHMSHLFLSHLSKENNSPEIALALFGAQASGIKIIHASRYNETGVFCIPGDSAFAGADSVFENSRVQLELF